MTGKRIGLVIGNNYQNSDKELKYAVADATKMKEILENKNICYFDNVVSVINKNSIEALNELEKLFKDAHQDDLIFIYFSGHGKKDFTNNLCLLFEDTKEEFLLSTSLSFDFINKCRKYPQALKASVIIVLDCCYSSTAGMKDTDITETLATYCSSGTVILTSTGYIGSSTAIEDDELGHSVFTYYLIEGLEKGYADKKGEGYISIDDLYNYSFEMTSKKGLQYPKKEGSIEGTIVIGKNPVIVRNKEYELKNKKLLDELSTQLPSNILGECQAILRKHYKNPFLLGKSDKIILYYIESLLKDDLSPEKRNDFIQNCIEAVQQLKGTSKKQQEEKDRKREKKEKARGRKEQESLRNYKDEVIGKVKENIGVKYLEKKFFVVGIGIIFGILLILSVNHSFNEKPLSVINNDQTNQLQNSTIDKNISHVEKNTAINLVDEILSLNSMGRYDEALQLCNKSIEMDPNSSNAWGAKCTILLTLERYDEALQACDKTIELDPNLAAAWNNKGVALDNLDRYDEALQACNKSIEMDPNSVSGWAEKGNALNNLGRYDEAIQACDKALELDPNHSYTWSLKGIIYDNWGRFNEALIECNKSIELDPNNFFAWRAKGCALYNLGKYDEAIQACDKAIEIKPNDPTVWIFKGEALNKLGRHNEAYKCFKNFENLSKQKF